MSIASMSSVPLIVSPRQLSKALESRARPIRLLDCSWHMPSSPRDALAEFHEAHLPQAHFWPVDEVADVAHPSGVPHMLPPASVFARAASKAGIQRDDWVVVYDSVGVFAAPRTSYTFRAFGHHTVSVLDGGLPRWKADGQLLESGEQREREPSGYPQPQLDPSLVRSFQQILANTHRDPSKDSTAEIVMDARPAARFDGSAPEPRPGLSSGHMPHSISVPFSSLLDSSQAGYTTLRTADELQYAFIDALGGAAALDQLRAGKRSLITSCGSGMTAAIIWLAAKLLAIPKVSIFDEVSMIPERL
ncbi:uncharacterized protein L969DRAFT_53738 [Mixia osmundae IAM 14324]|uniref:Rhodanese domain-containing protein n=1 Tax=Mixia osmundae (strain CBS 9802 / IAM 14324 / JCM 22182 / KY 12970) TaxID=764103 RepID=G7EAW7_MIXOS|nr:uncharacterized protein L969DRAFT_53738 [Mixia osmundae IAM 14324]KEI37012.1 hypothetical protein L969DRAFT_53738 [Mixia osmundae IAM 14324]GAA99977.1 hypothetical protein E5Q_06680 [Mixia osmundae IAM 14324]